ncbi:SET domain-containing protein [Angomonas deanei]|uniref:SET domain containing protein, putative n=1 Tax=Angomonas deanei TaxID=59799 RepID=A0A7G2CJW2_9TRYP|nr:SET domain-containing protein [Angomonas deanei]CAD2219347.1 SET domain containing protein, putative [Angomonas deanei]|eukprot:EPY18167.1 SET domain-containing protein [Angomonas deanei]
MAKNQIPQEDLDTFVIVTLIIAACVSEGEEDFLKFNVNQNLVRETIGLGNETTTPDSFLNTGDHTQTRRATFDELLCLATNVSGTDPEIIKDFSKLYRIYKKTLNSKKAEEIRHFFSTDVTIEVFTGIACAYMCNGFGVWSPTNKKHGTAVYPLSSYFNHSCAPNTGRRLIKGTRTLEFFTTRDVEPGESLCFSYIDIKRPAKERVEKLKATYSFVCQCTRCSLPGDEADSVCNGYVPPLCNFCISKVMQPLKDGKYICPCCDTIQMPE